MSAPIYNPAMPYLGPVFGGMSSGKMVLIQGTAFPNAQRISINFQCGPNIVPRDDVALHIDVRYINSTIIRNSLVMQQWGPEDVFGPFPLAPGQSFEFMILVEPHTFKIAINGLHYAEYNHRMPVERVSYLAIEGDATLSCIRFEGGGTSYVPTPGSVPYMPPPTVTYTPPTVPYAAGGAAPYPVGQVVHPGGAPYPVGQVVPPGGAPYGGGAYPRQAGAGYSVIPPTTYTTFPHSPTHSPYHSPYHSPHHSPRHSPRHSPHVSRSAAIPIAGGAAAGLLTGALLMGHHGHHKMKKQKKWMKKAFKHKHMFKHKHKHGFHFHHGFHHHGSSSSSEEE